MIRPKSPEYVEGYYVAYLKFHRPMFCFLWFIVGMAIGFLLGVLL